MDEDIFYLDLNKVTLLGFEQRNLYSKVEEMVNAIERGDDFPPVFVRHLYGDTYRLTHDRVEGKFRPEGGHHRAIAHYITNIPLKCRWGHSVVNCEKFLIELVCSGKFSQPQSEIDYICNFAGFFPIDQAILVDELPESIEIPTSFLG